MRPDWPGGSRARANGCKLATSRVRGQGVNCNADDLSVPGQACLARCTVFRWIGFAGLGPGSDFVQSSNGMLTLGGSPFRFGGTNSYPLMYSNQSTVKQILTTAANSNLKVVRMWVFCDSSCGNGFYFQSFPTGASAPAYNDSPCNGFANVDLAVNQANTLRIKLIMTLTNNWTDFGGMDTYVKWRRRLIPRRLLHRFHNPQMVRELGQPRVDSREYGCGSVLQRGLQG